MLITGLRTNEARAYLREEMRSGNLPIPGDLFKPRDERFKKEPLLLLGFSIERDTQIGRWRVCLILLNSAGSWYLQPWALLNDYDRVAGLSWEETVEQYDKLLMEPAA
jgi:hypothetical protein